MDCARSSRRLWSIVLAGGEGGTCRPLIQRWLGRPKPKQYCTFIGTRSMLQHTLDRAAELGEPDRIVTVVARDHRREAWSHLDGRAAGTVLLQPKNCETVAGIFLPLTHIIARDPQATVAIFPSDHFVYPESRFLDSVQRAVWTAEGFPDRLVLLGVTPDRLELDYGWIQPGEYLSTSSGSGREVRAVRTVLEKPSAPEADAALAGGALWNTLVMAAKVETLWELGRQCFPDMMPLFEQLSGAIGTSQEVRTLDAIYQRMPSYNFSSSLLQRVPERLAVIEMRDVLWSDWGKPERIANMLRRIGRQPAFPLECLSRPFAPIPLAAGEGGLMVNA